MYERNINVLEMFVEKKLGYVETNNIKNNYYDYKELVKVLDEYLNICDEQAKAKQAYDLAVTNIQNIQATKEKLYNQNVKFEYSRNILFSDVNRKVEDIEKCITKIESALDKNKDTFKTLRKSIGIVQQDVFLFNGSIKVGDKIKMKATDAIYEVVEVGVNTPRPTKRESLSAGEVGYVTASIKSISDVKVGDTIVNVNNSADALIGYKEIKPMVFCGLYPIDSKKYMELKEALEKLKLNDASLSYEPETSKALGFGFRCGFLGMLHMDVIEERIEREFNIDLIATSPSVVYDVLLTDGSRVLVENPTKLPDRTVIKEITEPYIKTNIFVPTEYVGSVMELCQDKRGTFVNMEYIDPTRVNIHYEIPLSEIVYDFFDKLKSYTKGYASFDYDFIGNKVSNLVKMDILINGEAVDALSIIVHKDFAYKRARVIVDNLKNTTTISLTATPTDIKKVAKYVNEQNARLSRQVAISVKVLQVNLNDSDSFGLDLTAQWMDKHDKDRNFTLASAASIIGDDVTKNLGISIMPGEWEVGAGIKALSKKNTVNLITSGTVTTMNNKPAPIQVVKKQNYISEITKTNSGGDGDSYDISTETEEIETGFTMSVLPRILEHGRLMVMFNLTLSDLLELEKVIIGEEADGQYIQNPIIESRGFSQEVVMKSGESLVLTGYERVENEATKTGVGSADNSLLGGSAIAGKTRSILVIRR